MQPYRSVLVGFDFRPCSAEALQQAIRLAHGSRAEIRVVHVVDSLVASELEEALSEHQDDVREGLRSDAREAWSEFASDVPGADRASFEVVIDARVHGILQRARSTKSDLLVLGAVGSQPPEPGFGSVAMGCARGAPCDVLLVRNTQRGPFETIVAAVDFSESSADALRRAAQIAAVDGAALHVVHVFRPPWRRLHYRAPTIQTAPHFIKQYGDGLARRLEQFARTTLPASPVPLRCELFDQGSHRSGIIAYAQQAKADLIALGTRGRSNVRDILLGSTAEKALDHSSCSVLAVRAAG